MSFLLQHAHGKPTSVAAEHSSSRRLDDMVPYACPVGDSTRETLGLATLQKVSKLIGDVVIDTSLEDDSDEPLPNSSNDTATSTHRFSQSKSLVALQNASAGFISVNASTSIRRQRAKRTAATSRLATWIAPVFGDAATNLMKDVTNFVYGDAEKQQPEEDYINELPFYGDSSAEELAQNGGLIAELHLPRLTLQGLTANGSFSSSLFDFLTDLRKNLCKIAGIDGTQLQIGGIHERFIRGEAGDTNNEILLRLIFTKATTIFHEGYHVIVKGVDPQQAVEKIDTALTSNRMHGNLPKVLEHASISVSMTSGIDVEGVAQEGDSPQAGTPSLMCMILVCAFMGILILLAII